MNRVLERILNLIFPNVCGFCDTICKNGVCDKCFDELKKYKKEKITKLANKNFDELIYLYEYKGIVRDTIIKYKFYENAYIYKALVYIILKSKKVSQKISSNDIIIPVPIHSKRMLERGYNQSYLISREISEHLNIKIYSRVLKKVKNTAMQSGLTKINRSQNVRNAYKIIDSNKNKIKDKKILLVDDVYTTGCTTDECSRMLKLAGAKEVTVLVIAKD